MGDSPIPLVVMSSKIVLPDKARVASTYADKISGCIFLFSINDGEQPMDIFFTYAPCVLAMLLFLSILLTAASIRIVREDTRLTVYRLGRKLGDKGPGIVLLIPFIDRGEIKKLGEPDNSSSGHK